MNKPHFNRDRELTTLERIDESGELRSAIDRDFGSAIAELNDGFSRRRWLQLMGASLALGGMSGCRYQEEKIAPFAFRPQNRVPGVPEKYAALIDFGGVAQPLLATCYDGRPIKLDGNPDHPCVQGASTHFTQAAILNLYDPDRLRGPMMRREGGYQGCQWTDVLSAGRGAFAGNDLSALAIVSQEIGAPSLMRLKAEMTSRGAQWFVFSSVNDDNTRAGAKAAFGRPLRMHCDLAAAKIIVSIDADPLCNHPDALNNNRQFAAGRDADHGQMSRLYVVESQFSITGGMADHRISVPSSEIAGFVGALAAAIDSVSAGDDIDPALSYRDRVLSCMAADLANYAGRSAILCGERQPAEVHAAVHALNEKLGNHGKTITFTKLVDEDRPGAMESIRGLAEKLKAKQIKSLVVLGGNPVFDAPSSLELAKLFESLEDSFHITTHKNETSVCCKWIVDAAHQLETWSDGWAYDGTVCIGQPLINPLFNSKSELEILSEFSGRDTRQGLEIIQQTHQLDAKSWAQAVHDGFVRDSQARFEAVSAGEVTLPAASDSWKKGWDESTYEIVFSPSSSVYDGRFANNAWLQELPDLLTKLTWGNAASISPRTAAKLGVRTGQTINVGNIGLPIVIQPGQADGTIGLTLGYGRTQSGMVGGNIAAGEQVGVDIRPLRTIDRWNFGPIKNVNPTMDWTRLAIVQEPWDIDQTGRNEIQARMFRDKSKSESERSWLIREGSFASYQEFLAKLGDGHGPGHAAVEEKGNGPSVRVNEQDKSASLQRDRKSLPAPLPVLNSGHYTSASAPAATGGDQDPHPAQHHWPEAFHLHQELFDITPGSRMEYTAQNPENKNMWGMAIDLNKCTGCNACVVACQSENNIPIVGREQVARGREMHWLRIDRYYGKNLYNEEAAESDDLQMVHQPVTCQHCENAPCETVCPVAATVHSSEGLNDMVYNRCIGTRYCGNNCPYKVRRFNYLNYSDAVTFLKYPGADKLSAADRSIQNLLMNPEVTIRSRGVMEKCTYCVQRISAGRINAKTDGNRPLGPNEITTACQDACPAKAITFGDINHLQSDVRKAHDNPRSYVMLEELNNHPRTRFLARVRNPHPALVDFDDRNSVRGYNKKMAAGKPPVADHKAEVERPQLEH